MIPASRFECCASTGIVCVIFLCLCTGGAQAPSPGGVTPRDGEEDDSLPERLARNIRTMVQFVDNLDSSEPAQGPLKRKKSARSVTAPAPTEDNGDVLIPAFDGRAEEGDYFMGALLRVLRRREVIGNTATAATGPKLTDDTTKEDNPQASTPMWSPPVSKSPL